MKYFNIYMYLILSTFGPFVSDRLMNNLTFKCFFFLCMIFKEPLAFLIYLHFGDKKTPHHLPLFNLLEKAFSFLALFE